MNTESMINQIIDSAYVLYKKQGRNCEEGLKLDRKQPVEIDGHVFCGWREYVVYKVGCYIQEKVPSIEVQINLDGNKSSIELSCTDTEQRQLNGIMNSFLKTLSV